VDAASLCGRSVVQISGDAKESPGEYYVVVTKSELGWRFSTIIMVAQF
jgi:hypothetical protein